jgi:hypothetical protein
LHLMTSCRPPDQGRLSESFATHVGELFDVFNGSHSGGGGGSGGGGDAGVGETPPMLYILTDDCPEFGGAVCAGSGNASSSDASPDASSDASSSSSSSHPCFLRDAIADFVAAHPNAAGRVRAFFAKTSSSRIQLPPNVKDKDRLNVNIQLLQERLVEKLSEWYPAALRENPELTYLMTFHDDTVLMHRNFWRFLRALDGSVDDDTPVGVRTSRMQLPHSWKHLLVSTMRRSLNLKRDVLVSQILLFQIQLVPLHPGVFRHRTRRRSVLLRHVELPSRQRRRVLRAGRGRVRYERRRAAGDGGQHAGVSALRRRRRRVATVGRRPLRRGRCKLHSVYP